MAVDKQYPVLPSIRGLLPDDECLVKRVLSNPEAAKAIMYLTDRELCLKAMQGKGRNGERFALVLLDGEAWKPTVMSATDLRRWLEMRDIPTVNMAEGALKKAVLKRIMYPDTAELTRAKARIANVVKEFHRLQ